jgi:sarcosine oxidase subunit gamma
MSEAVTSLGGRSTAGAVKVSDAGLRGMITLRGDLGDAAVQAAATKVAGVPMPPQRQILQEGERGLAWMSPDELLILLPYAEAEAAVVEISAALAGTPHLVVNVSDARSVMVLDGPGVREVLAKGAPADLRPSRLSPGEIRRTRLGQVAAAFWLTDERRAELVCFRSVGPFVFDWLEVAARPGSLPGHF